MSFDDSRNRELLRGPHGIEAAIEKSHGSERNRSMTQQRDRDGLATAVTQPARRLVWLSRAGLLVSLTLSSSAMAEDSRFLKLPSFMRKNEQPTVQPQQQRPEQRVATDDRVLNRARQLMSEARREEVQGRLENAIDLAARADGVYRAAQRTTDARWPANEQTPADYVRQLEGKLLARANQPKTNGPAAAVSIGTLPGQNKDAARTQQLANAAVNSLANGTDFGRTQRPDDSLEAAASTADQLRSDFSLPSPTKALEGLTTQGRNILEVATTAKGIADVVLEPTQPEPSDGQEPLPSEPIRQEPTKVDKSLQTARTVLDRLDQMQHWQPVSSEKPVKEKPGEQGDPPLPSDDEASFKSSANNPILIGTPSGISDDQVNPIPTQFHADHSTDGNPSPIEIRFPSDPRDTPGKLQDLPGKPLGAGATSGRADALLMPAIGSSDKPIETEKPAKSATHPLWVVGTVQAIATFVGALGAILVVLGLRPKSKANAAVVVPTATVEATPQAVAAVAETHDAAVDAGHHEPTTIPFRRNETAAEKDAAKVPAITHEAAAKSVFEQNLQLLDELNHLNEKKAA